MLSKSLQLTFRNATGKNVIVTIPEPKTPLTDVEVKTAMEGIITGNYFQSAGGDLKDIVGARIISRDASELAVI
jgi:hypothetical protein